MLNTLDVKQIVSLGGGVNIDAMHFTATDIKAIASLAATSGATIIIRNSASTVSTLDIKAIASLAPGKIVFEL